MARRFEGGKLAVASHNAGKVRELEALLALYGADCVSAAALRLPEPEETGLTFIANAELKARAAAAGAGLPALADDSGLAVDALGGEPGIYSARWAGPGRDFAAAMAEVERRLRLLGAVTPARRRGRFVSALTLAWPDGHAESFEGTVEGTLVWPPRGENGFGYDPMFLADGARLTFGEMTHEEKLPLTHRARAFRLLLDACFRPPA
jgi:XTP/dITP diphosphohydrolase